MPVKVNRDLFEDVARQVDVEEIMEDGHEHFNGATNRPFPAFKVDKESTTAQFLVLLGTYAEDPECEDIDEITALAMAERIMTEPFGRGLIVGFPGVELTG